MGEERDENGEAVLTQERPEVLMAECGDGTAERERGTRVRYRGSWVTGGAGGAGGAGAGGRGVGEGGD